LAIRINRSTVLTDVFLVVDNRVGMIVKSL
jgi:hypothetical protein